MSRTINDTFTLLSGRKMPYLGFGVFQAKGNECYDAVKEAIKVGYRHSEPAVAAGVPRSF